MADGSTLPRGVDAALRLMGRLCKSDSDIRLLFLLKCSPHFLATTDVGAQLLAACDACGVDPAALGVDFFDTIAARVRGEPVEPIDPKAFVWAGRKDEAVALYHQHKAGWSGVFQAVMMQTRPQGGFWIFKTCADAVVRLSTAVAEGGIRIGGRAHTVHHFIEHRTIAECTRITESVWDSEANLSELRETETHWQFDEDDAEFTARKLPAFLRERMGQTGVVDDAVDAVPVVVWCNTRPHGEDTKISHHFIIRLLGTPWHHEVVGERLIAPHRRDIASVLQKKTRRNADDLRRPELLVDVGMIKASSGVRGLPGRKAEGEAAPHLVALTVFGCKGRRVDNTPYPPRQTEQDALRQAMEASFSIPHEDSLPLKLLRAGSPGEADRGKTVQGRAALHMCKPLEGQISRGVAPPSMDAEPLSSVLPPWLLGRVKVEKVQSGRMCHENWAKTLPHHIRDAVRHIVSVKGLYCPTKLSQGEPAIHSHSGNQIVLALRGVNMPVYARCTRCEKSDPCLANKYVTVILGAKGKIPWVTFTEALLIRLEKGQKNSIQKQDAPERSTYLCSVTPPCKQPFSVHVPPPCIPI